MVLMDRIWCLALAAALSGPALAEEDANDADGIQGLLDSLPEIKAPGADEAKAKKEREDLNYSTYNGICSAKVMAHFKAPRSVTKKHPAVEFQMLVAVDAEGLVTGLSANKRSGHRSFDTAALDALNAVGQFPAPPSGWSLATDRVLLTFTANSGR